MFKRKHWTQEEVSELKKLPTNLSRGEYGKACQVVAKKLKREVHVIQQKHWRMLNKINRRDCVPDPKEYVVTKPLYRRKGKSVKAKVSKKASTSLKFESGGNNNVRVTKTSVIIVNFTDIKIRGNKIKINYKAE